MTKPSVAHIKSPFLPPSETFIHSYIAHLAHYEPVVVTETWINQDRFPVSRVIARRQGRAWYDATLADARAWLATRVQRELLFARFYGRALRRAAPDVAHVHFGVTGLLLSPLLRALELPTVISFYGHDLSQVPNALGHDVYARNSFFDGQRLFTAEGGSARRQLMALGCPEEKARLLRIGVDLSAFTFAPRWLTVGETPRLLFCGRFVRKKGLLTLLRAAARLRDRNVTFHLDVIGDGPERADAEHLIGDLNLQAHVTLHGMVTHEVFNDACRRAHVFVAPSATDRRTGETEGGAPTVILEAQASGMPIVSTRHADIPEIVLDGRSGRLVAEESDVELADAVEDVLARPHDWIRMGEEGRAHVERQHDATSIGRQLESLYDEVRGVAAALPA